jgi:hypothetical protein
MWVNTATPDEMWPIALVGPLRKPVDFFATVRGEVPMARKDRCAWMTLSEYFEAMKQMLATAASEETG